MSLLALRSLDDVRKLVRDERRRRSLTQAQAAGLINHTQKWLSDFETGKVNPPANMVFDILRLLGVRLEARVLPADAAESDELGVELEF